jgi:hypothetical protein
MHGDTQLKCKYMFRSRVWKILQCSFLQIFDSSVLKFIKSAAVFVKDLFVGKLNMLLPYVAVSLRFCVNTSHFDQTNRKVISYAILQPITTRHLLKIFINPGFIPEVYRSRTMTSPWAWWQNERHNPSCKRTFQSQQLIQGNKLIPVKSALTMETLNRTETLTFHLHPKLTDWKEVAFSCQSSAVHKQR